MMSKEWYKNAENEAFLAENYPDLVPFAKQVCELVDKAFDHGRNVGRKEGEETGYRHGYANGRDSGYMQDAGYDYL